MTPAQVERLLQIARDATLGGTFADRFRAIADTLTALVPSASLTAMVVDPAAGGRPTHAYYHNGDPEEVAIYAQRYLEHDPMRIGMGDFGRVQTMSDYASGRAFGRDAYTGEFLPRLGVRYIMACSSPMPDSRSLMIAIQRLKGARDFSGRERELLRVAMTDLARAAVSSIRSERLAQLARGRSGRPVSSGAVVFDPNGGIAQADPLSAGLLKAMLDDAPALGETLERDVQASFAGERVPPERIFALDDEQCVHVRYARLDDRMVAVIARIRTGTHAHADLVARIAGLSERERQIAAKAVEGHGNQRIAYLLGIAPATVACHLTRVYQKLGVASRTELAGALLGRPSLRD